MADIEIDLPSLRRLMEMIDGDAEDLAEFVGDFSDIAPKLVADMAQALASEDWGKMRIAAHTLKSNANDMGAAHLSALAGVVETQCKQAPDTISTEQITQIETVQIASVDQMSQIEFATLAS